MDIRDLENHLCVSLDIENISEIVIGGGTRQPEERNFREQKPVDGSFITVDGSRLVCKPNDDHLYWQKSHKHEQVPLDINAIHEVSCGVCNQEALGFSWKQKVDVSDVQDNQILQQTICLQCIYDTALHFKTQQEFLLKNGDPVTNYKKIFNETLAAQQREIQQLRADFARLKLFVARKSL